jgi:hypothetical protein
MFDIPPRAAAPNPVLAAALERAAAAIARLDQALTGHPLQRAFLYRARLEAVRQQAAVDGQVIDPWHLAAVLEGLRLRMEHALRIIDRGAVFEAARHALALHQWLSAPDLAQEGAIRSAAAHLAASGSEAPPLLAAALGAHAWLEQGGARAPLRAALVRHWTRSRLLRLPVPLTGAAALRPDTPWAREAWTPRFLAALAAEAEAALMLLQELERAWFAARQAVAGRRRDSRAPAAIDLLAAAPVLSASSLAHGLGIAVKNAAALLEQFSALGITVEVTHRAKRRLFGLKGLAPLRDRVAPPRRPMPGRGRGRPRRTPEVEEAPAPPLPPPAPLAPLARRAFDTSDLTRWMAEADQAIRRTQRLLDALATGRDP